MRLAMMAAALVAVISLAACDEGDSEQDATATPHETLQVLMRVGEGLPRYPALVVDEEYIYTGGEVTDSVYWSKDPVNYVMHFYWERLPPAGWNATGPWVSVPGGSKDQAGGWVLVAERGAFRIQLTVAENTEKDPTRGTTRLGVRIERIDVSATAPPILPTPTSPEPGI